MPERVQKILSQWGIASRRHAERMIRDGRVRLNGEVARLGQKADPERDRLEIDGAIVRPSSRPESLYILLDKPAGVLSTCDDPRGRRTALDLLPEELRSGRGLHPVGRLDRQSTGALLLTNDGDLTLRLTHPRYHLPKTYRVWTRGDPPEAVLETWRRGVILDGKKTLPAGVTAIERRGDRALLEIELVEGRNRQIRRVAERLGFEVLELRRVAIGAIRLASGDRPAPGRGRYRFLEDREIRYLKGEIDCPQLEGAPPAPNDSIQRFPARRGV